MTIMGVAPAYGRDYKNKSEVLDAWNSDLDFILTDLNAGGRYVNRRDLRVSGFTGKLKIRYGGMRKVLVLDLDYSRCEAEG